MKKKKDSINLTFVIKVGFWIAFFAAGVYLRQDLEVKKPNHGVGLESAEEKYFIPKSAIRR